MPWLGLMVTGGVEPTVESLKGWFGAGVRCVGIGSNLFPKPMIDAGRWDEIADGVRKTVDTIIQIRS
jgi:2-dehydro-3-deoxyphosphogluconate aldolase/(4S)-4-hydroxy-2-oxoglutarate aldolase